MSESVYLNSSVRTEINFQIKVDSTTDTGLNGIPEEF